MELANQLIFLGGTLLAVSILAGVVSSRIGAPLLLVFLGLGMLAGEDGPGGIRFDDFRSAYTVGSLALAVILFDGGLRTPTSALRAAWAPASVLATVGVLVTAAVAGLVAMWVLGVGPAEGFLMGAIIGSTDAAAVFLLLHQRGTALRRRLSATLEVESGANDPMAFFLTITLVEALRLNSGDLSWTVTQQFLLQLGLGTAIGGFGGLALAWLVNRLELASGLYPVFAIASALLIYGGAQLAGGSGFLAVYLAGIVAGNQRLRASRLIRRFHDGLAWVSQIVMFFMLGLLVTPSSLIPDIVPATIVALALIFLARPIAVFLCLLPFRFSAEERLFISWVGLRGAVPIFLGIVPVLGGLPNALQYYNVAYLVVLTSLLLQGWSIPWVARRLELDLPPAPESAGRLDLDLQPQFDRDLIGYRLTDRSPTVGKALDQLLLPRRARVIAILRDNVVVRKETLGALQSDDYLLLLSPPEEAIALDRLFLPEPASGWRHLAASMGDFSFSADAPLGALAQEYQLPIPEQQRDIKLGAFMRSQLGDEPAVGDRLDLGDVELVVQALDGREISRVGLRLEPLRPRLFRWLLSRLRWRREKAVAEAGSPEAESAPRAVEDSHELTPRRPAEDGD